MPEIWLNYGITDVVLDIRAENLEQKIDSDGKTLEDSAINEKLNASMNLSNLWNWWYCTIQNLPKDYLINVYAL